MKPIPTIERSAAPAIAQHVSARPHDYRCTCGRLLFRAAFTPGSMVEIRCVKCSRLQRITDETLPDRPTTLPDSELHD